MPAKKTTRPVVADIRQWGSMDTILESNHRFMPGDVKSVSFKDEDDVDGTTIGPALLDNAYIGWVSRPQAMKIARYLGAKFEEV